MSMSRHCGIYKATDLKWYMELAEEEYGDSSDADCYGPFDSQEDADKYLSDNFSNPGGLDLDESCRRAPPTKAPNGSAVQRPTRGRSW